MSGIIAMKKIAEYREESLCVVLSRASRMGPRLASEKS